MQVAGHYFFPLSAKFVEAKAELADNGNALSVIDSNGEELTQAPLRTLRATSRLGAIRRKLDFPDGGRFETGDNDAVDAILCRRLGGSILHRLENSWRIVCAAVIFAAAASAAFAFYGVPATADWLARNTPASVAGFMTQQSLAVMDKGALRPTTLSRKNQERFRALFVAVAAKAPRGVGGYRLLFRNAPALGPNAFALPDGTIVVTDQILAMVQNDDEIEGVFAHEMSHVDHAHGLQRVYQASLVPATIAFITGDATQVSHFATVLPGVLLQSAYSRQFEQQADDDAAALLRRMGKNPSHLADLLERMEKKMCGTGGCNAGWLGSHPAIGERAARLRRS